MRSKTGALSGAIAAIAMIGAQIGPGRRLDDEVMDSFEDQGTVVGPSEHVLGGRQRSPQHQRGGRDTGLLGNLAHRGRLGCLAGLDVAFGEAPEAPVADQADLVAVLGSTHDDSA